MSQPPPSHDLPEAIEDEVLAILDGDEAARDAALAALLARCGEHAHTIRAWLGGAGVVVPGDAAAGPSGTTGSGSPGGATGSPGPGGEALPLRLGPYVLQRLLGRGGFGSVYRAEQQEPIRRPVAVKVLNPGMDSREVLARFAAEREALNRMDHPGIARLLDAGSTPQGRPFFVMELVEGPTLANLCREDDLPLRARMQLFLLVLDAMQHAHTKAVLHRDLSSNNVLVADPRGRPQPKIIDFGIAKSLNDPLLQGGAMTFQGTLMGTPEFMSPEQASGRIDDLDTRADVYALGVQLYELLTDQMPIPGVVLRAQGLAGMADVIARHQPLLPSQVAPKARRAALLGDLDAIVMKAIAKSRDERYPTVAAFAADLRAHLADEPVQVGAPTTWHRLRKFVRRNRAQTIAGGIVAVGLVAACAVLWWALGIAKAALQKEALDKAEIKAKADAGFRLLANEARLREANAAAAALPAPWPEHEAAFARWFSEHGEPLAAELDKLRDKVRALQRGRDASPGQRFADPDDEYLLGALERLQAGLGEFVGPHGPLQRVHGALRFLREVAAPAQREQAAAWRETIEAIRTGVGEKPGRSYRGVRLPELPGLVPLGQDPRTGLFEFLDLASHTPGVPRPVRGDDGTLRPGPGAGIVFVLVPGGVFRIGAFRGEPGLPQNDDAAQDDELGGQLVQLDEFLIAETELTAAQWANLAGEEPPRDGQLPRTNVDWPTARSLLRRFDLDLPTEAQWEYACRAGATTPWWCGADPRELLHCAWFGPRPQRVARLQPNPFGLYDVCGNAAEWCRDELLKYADFVPGTGDGLRQRPGGAPAAAPRVVRGGACYQGPAAARSAAREARAPDVSDSAVGVRPVRVWRNH